MPQPPLLLIHGTNAAAWTMEPVRATFLKAGFTCTSLTYRHHDLPPGEDRNAKLQGLGIADYLDDARQAVAAMDEKPVIVGHSLGGLIAQKLAGEGLVAGGILLNSSIINGTLPTTDGERELGKMFMGAGAFWDEVFGQDFELLAKYGLSTLPLDLQHDIVDRLGTESGRVFFEFLYWMYDVNQTTKVDIDAVTCPLLFITSSEDVAVPPSAARQMAARYGDLAQVIEVENSCHYVQFDTQWPRIAAQAIDWLNKVFPD